MTIQPTGTVTFVFTDVEGSTSRWASHESQMALAIASHDEIVRTRVEEQRGYVFSRGGDSFAGCTGNEIRPAGGGAARREEGHRAAGSEEEVRAGPAKDSG